MRIANFLTFIHHAIQNSLLIEFIYRDKLNEKYYNLVAPICLNEFEGAWYLLTSDEQDNISIYAIKRILSVDNFYATFSLYKDLDYERFIEHYFDINKVL